MQVIITDNYGSMSCWAASVVARLVRDHPRCVLGLATGGTPVGLYQELIRLHKKETLDFSHVVTFNLDEYVGLSPFDEHSYRFFMQRNLFDHINIDPKNTHLPDGRARNFVKHGREYEQAIKDAGGIDLQVLGIGGDAHIGFNEPGSSLASRTRMVVLAEETVRDNARFFPSIDDVPRCAVTMGIGTILESRQCLLLANGVHKAKAVRNAIEGPICSACPASALQLHPDTIAVLDEDAADLLEWRDYYQYTQRVLAEWEHKLTVETVAKPTTAASLEVGHKLIDA
jgi:glucosamine-6-phosphate deaminase